MTTTLAEILSDPTKKDAVVADGVVMLEREVASKSGISGLAVKAGFKTVKKVKPGILAEALHMLLPQFAPKVDPFFIAAREAGDVRAYFVAHGTEIAEAMLEVTDGRADRSKHRVLRKAYFALRPTAVGHVVAAMPGLADLVEKHVPE